MDTFSGRQTRSVPQRGASAPAPSVAPEAAPADSRSRLVGSPAPQNNRDKKKSKLRIVGAILIIGLIVAALWWGVGALAGTPIQKNKYQAVFLSNSQVYFGKLSVKGGHYMLTDVFYLQTSSKADSTNPQESAASNSDVQLIKLGNEIHGPEDEMIISKDQVLFYENLKSESKVAESIQKYKSAN